MFHPSALTAYALDLIIYLFLSDWGNKIVYEWKKKPSV